MDETLFGSRDRRGHYAPKDPLTVAPLYQVPPDLRAVLAWLPSYFLPWNVVFAVSAVIYWHLLLPPVETMATLSTGWILRLYMINAVAVALFYGAFEFRLYIKRSQETRFKYNPRFPGDIKARIFWFQSQNVENILRTFLSGVTIWTIWGALTLWVFANGWVPWLGFAENPIYLGLFALLIPALHEAHFYVTHRLLHMRWLYRHVHSVHHKSVNPSPWSSLAMHPLEHAIYFSSVFYHLVLPSNPLLALYQLHFAGFGAIPGHVGFDKVELGGDKAMATHSYTHYLHHKFFEVNYGDGLVPFDKLFGTWHDGTEAGEAAMKARLRIRTNIGEQA